MLSLQNFLNFHIAVGGTRISQMAPTPGSANQIFGIIFAENFMKMKKNRLRRGAHVPHAPDPPLHCVKITKLPNH